MRVSYGGKKTYYVILRVSGRRQRHAIGSTQALSVDEARAAAREIRAQVLENEKPSVAHARKPPSSREAVGGATNNAVSSVAATAEASEERAGEGFFKGPEEVEQLIEQIPKGACPEAVQELQEVKQILETTRLRLEKRITRLLPVANAVATDSDIDDALTRFKTKYYASGKH